MDDVALLGADRQLLQPGRLPAQEVVGEPLERLADHHERAVVAARAEVQVGQPPGAPAVAPLGGEHDEVHGVHRLDLAPRTAAPPGVVHRVERLDHHALVPGADRPLEERRRLPGVGRDDRGQPGARRHHGCEDLPPGGERLVDDRRAAGVEHVEEVRRQPVPAPARGLRSEVAHRVLEPARCAVLVDPERLAVEHEVAAGQRGDELADRRKTVGDVVEVAGEQPHDTVAPVRLDARAVELPLDRCRAGRGERRGDVGRRGRQHRLHRPAGLHPDRHQRLRTTGQRGLGRQPEVTGEHVRPPHGGDRDARRLGDGVDHHAVEGPLAQLAGEHLPQQVLLGLGGPREHVAEQRPAGGVDPGAGHRGEPADGVVDLEHAERRLGGRLGADVPQRRPPDTDPPLAQGAGEHTDRHRYLGRRQSPQHVGEQRRLLTALGRRRQRPRRSGELDEQHGPSRYVAFRKAGATVDRTGGGRQRRRPAQHDRHCSLRDGDRGHGSGDRRCDERPRVHDDAGSRRRALRRRLGRRHAAHG